MDRRPFICDVDRGEEHLRDAERAYYQGREVIYVGRLMAPFRVQADVEELRAFRAQQR